jgi:hypothetical protein
MRIHASCDPGPGIELAAILDDRPIEIASVHLPSKTRNLFGDFQAPSRVRAVESSGFMERAMGIEPTSEAWEASILPLYDARSLSSLLIIHH